MAIISRGKFCLVPQFPYSEGQAICTSYYVLGNSDTVATFELFDNLAESVRADTDSHAYCCQSLFFFALKRRSDILYVSSLI